AADYSALSLQRAKRLVDTAAPFLARNREPNRHRLYACCKTPCAVQGCLFLLRLWLGLLLLLRGLLMRVGRRRNRSAFHSLCLRKRFGGQSLEFFGIVMRPTLARLERQRE